MTTDAPIFTITAIEHGWADIVIRDGMHTHSRGVSNLADGLGKFVAMVEQVATGVLSGAECRWSYKPGTVSITLRWCYCRPHAELRIGFSDDRGLRADVIPDFTTTFVAVVDVRELARDTIAAFARVRESYGAEGYRERWRHPLPQARLDALAAWLKADEEQRAGTALGAAVIRQLLCRGNRRSVAIAEMLGVPHAPVIAKLRELATHWGFELTERLDDGPDAVEAMVASFSPELQRHRERICRERSSDGPP